MNLLDHTHYHHTIVSQELTEANRSCSELQRALTEAQEAAAAVGDERNKLQRAVAAAEGALSKAKKAAAGAEERENSARVQLAAMQRDVATTARAAKGAETSSSTLEMRLARALEENERMKGELSAQRAAAADAERAHRAAISAAQLQVKRAERAKEEILGGFKKQLKLIDVLKRQRIHVRTTQSFFISCDATLFPLEDHFACSGFLAASTHDTQLFAPFYNALPCHCSSKPHARWHLQRRSLRRLSMLHRPEAVEAATRILLSTPVRLPCD